MYLSRPQFIIHFNGEINRSTKNSSEIDIKLSYGQGVSSLFLRFISQAWNPRHDLTLDLSFCHIAICLAWFANHFPHKDGLPKSRQVKFPKKSKDDQIEKPQYIPEQPPRFVQVPRLMTAHVSSLALKKCGMTDRMCCTMEWLPVSVKCVSEEKIVPS